LVSNATQTTDKPTPKAEEKKSEDKKPEDKKVQSKETATQKNITAPVNVKAEALKEVNESKAKVVEIAKEAAKAKDNELKKKQVQA